jgi:hypothetical protein
MDTTSLQRVPRSYRKVYQDNWWTIKESIKRGRLRDMLHFPLFQDYDGEIISKAQQMVANYSDKIKVNVAFGFILKNRTSGELKFFHPSNNTMLFTTPKLLDTAVDFKKFFDDIERQDAFEYARVQRPSTNWTVERIVCVRFDVYKM